MRSIRLIFGCATLVAFLASSGCSRPAASKVDDKSTAKAPPPSVRVLTLSQRPWKRTVLAQGSLIADESSVIGAKVAGRIATAPVEIGDRVKAGEVLAKLDTTDLASQAAQAQASLEQACAAIGITPDFPMDKVDPEKSPAVRQEKALLAEAKNNLDRAERLRKQDAIAEATLDQYKAAVDVAEARYQSSLNAVDEKIATIALRRAAHDLAKQQLADATIVAPYDGLVQTRQVGPGTFVSIGDPVATLVRIDPIRFRGQVPERAALQLRVGQPIDVTLENAKEPCRATIARISPALDEATRSLTFEADLPNIDGHLRAGLFATGQIELDPNATAIAVPARAVTVFAGVERVWAVVDGEAREIMIRTGEKQDGFAEVLDGLKTGDEIIVDDKPARAGPVEVIGRITLDPPETVLSRQTDEAGHEAASSSSVTPSE
jgi:RND family efflux transporter MFP subunit